MPPTTAPRTARRAAQPERDSRYRAVADKLAIESQRLKQHAPASRKVREASGAAKAPANERLATAKAKLVDQTKDAPTPKLEPSTFKVALRTQIEQAMPKTLGETEQFMNPGQAGALKHSLDDKVGQQQRSAAGPIDEATKRAPDPGTVPAVASNTLPTEPSSPAPRIEGAAAMPAPLPPDDISLQRSKQETSQQLTDNQIKPESLRRANDPRFSAVAGAQARVGSHADGAPNAFRAKEAVVLGAARAGANASTAKSANLLLGTRGRGHEKVLSRQRQQAAKEEAERKQVADKVEGIFTRTKQRVETSLAGLETDVSSMFDAGVDAALAAMKGFVDAKILAFKLERYLSIPGVGLYRWLRDQVLGLPAEVSVFYQQGRRVFQTTMDALIERVASLVETRLAQAKTEVAKGQAEIKTYVASLPANLKAAGQAAEGALGDRFAELSQGIDDKKNELASALAQKYKEAFDKADDALRQLHDENKGLLQKFTEKLGEVIKALLELRAKLMGILKKGQETIQLILDDPIGFLGNLLAAVKGGFNAFVTNIATHLKAGFIAWLFGSLATMGITLPSDLSLPSILKLVLSVLGITYEKMRAKAVKLLGERAVGLIEKAAEYVSELVTGGPAKLWEKVKDDLSNLKEMVIDAIQTWLIETVVKQAVTKVVSMFNPAGAIVQAVIAIYNVVMFVVEKAQQLMALVESVVNSVHAIATGAIGGAVSWIEKSLASAIPVVIGFLARLLGLSGITQKIREFIEKIQSKVDHAIDKAIAKVVATVKKLFGAVKAGAKKLLQWWKKSLPISGGGEKHTLTFEGSEKSARLVVRSKPQKPSEFLTVTAEENQVDKAKRATPIDKATTQEDAIDKIQTRLASIDDDGPESKMAASREKAIEADNLVSDLDVRLGVLQNHVADTLDSWQAADEILPDGEEWFKIPRPSFSPSQKQAIAARHRATTERKGSPSLLALNSENEEINVKRGYARRHVVSSSDMAKHYANVLCSKEPKKGKGATDKLRASSGKLLLEQRGSVAGARTPVSALTKAAIQEAATRRHAAFFGYAKNIFIGDSKENSSIQEHLDAGHPEMAEKQLKEHVRLIKRAWALDDTFVETPVKPDV